MSVSNRPTEHSDVTSQADIDSGTGVTSLRNGLVGGVVAVLLSVLPLSTMLGGGIAGYLDRNANRQGSVAGAVAGAVAFLPYLLIGVYLGLSGIPLPGPDLGLSPVVLIAGTTGFAFVYTVGLSLAGSLIGGYISDKRK